MSWIPNLRHLIISVRETPREISRSLTTAYSNSGGGQTAHLVVNTHRVIIIREVFASPIPQPPKQSLDAPNPRITVTGLVRTRIPPQHVVRTPEQAPYHDT